MEASEKKKNNLSNKISKSQKIEDLEGEKNKENLKVNDNNSSTSSSVKNSTKGNQDQIKLKLLKILFEEKPINNKEEKKKEEDLIKRNNNFYDTSTDFHRARLPKIKFRNTKDIKDENNNNGSEKKKNEQIEKIIENENENENEGDNLDENLNINKEKKKIKKIIKKKIKKKKKKNKKEEGRDKYETIADKNEAEESSTQEEKLSKSVQERNIDNKNIFNIIENKEKEKSNEKEKENIAKKYKEKEIIKEKEKNKEKEKEKNKEKHKETNKEKEKNNEKLKEIAKNKVSEKVKEKQKEDENQKVKEKEKEKGKEEENDKIKAKEIIKGKEKEKEIKLAKKEIIKKLIKYSGKKIFDLQGKAKLSLSSVIDKKDSNLKKTIKDEEEDPLSEKKEGIFQENKNDSLIKREQLLNAKLINNNSLSSKEKMRRKQLEKDLETEINNDDLSDEPYEETETDFNNINNKKEYEFKSHSTNKRKIFKKKNFDEQQTAKNKKTSNSLKNRKKIYNLKSYRKFRPAENRIYTPKKAIISRENSKRKGIGIGTRKKTNMRANTNTGNLYNDNNIFNKDFNADNAIKTKFKIFNENCIKANRTIFHENNTLDYNYPNSIEILSYINTNTINKDKIINLKQNNSKILYIKKSPIRDKEKKIEINNYYNNTIENKSIESMYINTFNNKYKNMLSNRFNTSMNERNITYDNNNYNLRPLNESNNEEIDNTFRIHSNSIFNKNSKLNSNNNNSFTFRRHIKIPNPFQPTLPKMNFEDLILIENKFFNIIHNLGEKKDITNDCFDLFNFYYNCSLYQSLIRFFNDPNLIKLNINYTLMSLLVSYDLSFNKIKLKNIYLLLLEMFIVNYRNLMLLIEFIINKINKNDINQFWVNKLINKIVKYKESQEGEEIDSYNNFGLSLIEKIKYNTHYLMEKIHYILLNYDESSNNTNNNNLLFFLKTINANSYDKINIFFKENIFRENFDFCSLLASSLIKNNLNKMNQPGVPYISFPNRKKYSLILDLDETLIYLDKINDENNGTLKIRPGTFSFLEKMQQFFEIIIFSEAEQNYVDLILDSVEESKKYFDYVLYRQHTTIQNEEFIKDLSNIGRKLSRMIIVDNMPQNFRLQPDNGIYIKPFWGSDNEDDVLFSLSDILTKIASEGGDLRDGLKKYKSEIIINVSCSFKDS